MRTVAVIPARLASTRLARKALREIAGKPLIGWVYEAVRSSPALTTSSSPLTLMKLSQSANATAGRPR